MEKKRQKLYSAGVLFHFLKNWVGLLLPVFFVRKEEIPLEKKLPIGFTSMLWYLISPIMKRNSHHLIWKSWWSWRQGCLDRASGTSKSIWMQVRLSSYSSEKRMQQRHCPWRVFRTNSRSIFSCEVFMNRVNLENNIVFKNLSSNDTQFLSIEKEKHFFSNCCALFWQEKEYFFQAGNDVNYKNAL